MDNIVHQIYFWTNHFFALLAKLWRDTKNVSLLTNFSTALWFDEHFLSYLFSSKC